MDFIIFWSALWILGTALFLYLTMMLVRWMTVRFSQGVEAKVRAAESIVNDERVPEAWAAPHRQQIETLRRSVGSEAEIERAGRRGLKDCLRQLDRLVQFFEKSNLLDSAESRHVLLTGLQRQRERWVAGGWQYVIERDHDHVGSVDILGRPLKIQQERKSGRPDRDFSGLNVAKDKTN